MFSRVLTSIATACSIIVVVLTSGSCNTVPGPDTIETNKSSAKRKPETVLPTEKDVGHVEIIRDVDRQLKSIGIQPLSSRSLPTGEMEVRVWKGWGMRGAKGVVLEKRRSGWKAGLITIPASGNAERPTVQSLPAPRSGWEAMWSELTARRISELPDDSEVGAVEPFEDSEQVIVDLLVGDQRRTYSYNAPCYSAVEAGQNVKRIGEIIASEFGLPWFDCN